MQKRNVDNESPVCVLDGPIPNELAPAPTPDAAVDDAPLDLEGIARELANGPASYGRVEFVNQGCDAQSRLARSGTYPIPTDAHIADRAQHDVALAERIEAGKLTFDPASRREFVLRVLQYMPRLQGFLDGSTERWRQLHAHRGTFSLGPAEHEELVLLEKMRADAEHLRGELGSMRLELLNLCPPTVQETLSNLRAALREPAPTAPQARASFEKSRREWSTALAAVESKLQTEPWESLEQGYGR